MARFGEKPGESSELAGKRAELSALRRRHAELRSVLHQLQSELAVFEESYDELLGRRVAELEVVEAEISRLYNADHAVPSMEDPAAYSTATHSTAEPKWQSQSTDIKSLYREVAKSIHPDLGTLRSGTLNRHELMSKANRAYAEDDRRTLQEILQKWWLAREEWDAEWADLVETKRLIAREMKAVSSVEAEVEAMRGSLAYRLKQRIDGGAIGCDLLADMVTAVDLSIARARQRLARLKNGKGEGQARAGARQAGEECSAAASDGASAGRVVRFPEELSCGVVYMRDRNSSNFSQWKRVGAAKGAYQVGPDMALRLDLRAGTVDLAHLRKLRPDDLQALFLYEVRDGDLDATLHLGGLEELYLSGEGISDAALGAISCLKSLKRIYIYQTGISDLGLTHLRNLPFLTGLTSSGNRITREGLAGFERVMPRVKTVSFQWRR